MDLRTMLGRGALGVLMVGALIWPAFWNGQPFFFPDTTAYVRGADAGIQKATGMTSSWTQSVAAETDQTLPDKVHVATRPTSSVEDKSVLSGRSVYYGALLYLGDRLGRFWPTVVLQAIAVVAALGLTLHALRIPLQPWLPITALAAGALTTAPFFVSFLTPDIFASITILGVATVVGIQRRLSSSSYAGWLVLLAAALMFHATHVLIAVSALVVAIGVNIVRSSWSNRRGLVLVALAVLVAIVAEAGFGLLVKRAMGFPPIRPPFIMARFIEDGPGFAYLRDTCPTSGFKVCEFVDRLPLPATAFLWETRGVFAASPPSTRRELADEQLRFVLSVLRYDPIGQSAASLRNMLRQLTSMGLSEFNYGETDKRYYRTKVPPEHLVTLEKTAAWRGSFPAAFVAVLTTALFAIALGYGGLNVFVARRRNSLPPPVLYVTTIIVAGVFINDAICGVMSGAFDRYGARVAWLIPLAAFLLYIGSRNTQET
jgi:hypothetical protein